MNLVTVQMEELAKIEYEAAKTDHGPLASMHEGWAVALEEIQETEEALNHAKQYLDEAWESIRADDPRGAEEAMDVSKFFAMRCACEAIQVAAVARRFLELQPPMERTKTP